MKTANLVGRTLLIALLSISSLVSTAATLEKAGRTQAIELLAQSSEILDQVGLDVSNPYLVETTWILTAQLQARASETNSARRRCSAL